MSSWWDTLSSAYSAVAETVAADSEAVNDDSNATATVTKKETGDYLLSITIENDADEVLEGDKVQTGGSNIFHVQVPASKAGMLEEIKIVYKLVCKLQMEQARTFRDHQELFEKQQAMITSLGGNPQDALHHFKETCKPKREEEGNLKEMIMNNTQTRVSLLRAEYALQEKQFELQSTQQQLYEHQQHWNKIQDWRGRAGVAEKTADEMLREISRLNSSIVDEQQQRQTTETKLETEKRSAQRRVELLERQLSLKEDQIQQLLNSPHNHLARNNDPDSLQSKIRQYELKLEEYRLKEEFANEHLLALDEKVLKSQMLYCRTNQAKSVDVSSWLNKDAVMDLKARRPKMQLRRCFNVNIQNSPRKTPVGVCQANNSVTIPPTSIDDRMESANLLRERHLVVVHHESARSALEKGLSLLAVHELEAIMQKEKKEKVSHGEETGYTTLYSLCEKALESRLRGFENRKKKANLLLKSIALSKTEVERLREDLQQLRSSTENLTISKITEQEALFTKVAHQLSQAFANAQSNESKALESLRLSQKEIEKLRNDFHSQYTKEMRKEIVDLRQLAFASFKAVDIPVDSVMASIAHISAAQKNDFRKKLYHVQEHCQQLGFLMKKDSKSIQSQFKKHNKSLSFVAQGILSKYKEDLARKRGQFNAEFMQYKQQTEATLNQKLNEQREQHEHEIREQQDKLHQLQMDHKGNLESLRMEKQHKLDELEQIIEKEQKERGDMISAHQHEIDDIRRNSYRQAEEALNEKHRQAILKIEAETERKIQCEKKGREDAFEHYRQERHKRRHIQNEMSELKGNIRVFCRVRPILTQERKHEKCINICSFPMEAQLKLFMDSSKTTAKEFEFDEVFLPETKQDTVFEAVSPMIDSAMDGYNVCIFAYGQTGSGKTFTMEGTDADPGVYMKTFSKVFDVADSRKEQWSYSVKLSLLEIYNESIWDLLAPYSTTGIEKKRKKLEIREGSISMIVPGLSAVNVDNTATALKTLRKGIQSRQVGATDMHEHSSRSHLVVKIVIEGNSCLDEETMNSTINLIDLAGSERVSKTDASGDRLKEAQNINRSLSALGDVVNSLGKNSKHTPFRNSKLTYLLKDCLMGDSKVLMFANISPILWNGTESLASLHFASRCRSVELGKPKKQKGTTELVKLKNRIQELEETVEHSAARG